MYQARGVRHSQKSRTLCMEIFFARNLKSENYPNFEPTPYTGRCAGHDQLHVICKLAICAMAHSDRELAGSPTVTLLLSVGYFGSLLTFSYRHVR